MDSVLTHGDPSMTSTAVHERSLSRGDWMGVLASAPWLEVDELCQPILQAHRFEWLREPETGLMMVQARIGNTGDRFNLGECTVTRCSVLHPAPGGLGLLGTAYVLGRSFDHAHAAARMDALLQREDLHEDLRRRVIEPLRQRKLRRDRDEQASTATSRVRFVTLQGEVGVAS